MKATDIFKQYIWLVDLIYRSGGISLQEMNKRWMKSNLSDGCPMSRATFNRHKEAIEDIFNVVIRCNRKGGYFYYIDNDKVFKDSNMQNWMLDSLSISNLLMESHSLNNRISLEDIPSGKQFLQPLIDAMKQSRKVLMTYRKFGRLEGYTILVEPYAIKVFKQRWYLVANNYRAGVPVVYALDRMVALEEAEETFVYPSDFDVDIFFNDCYGVFCGSDVKAQKVVIRAYSPLPDYLRTLPLHHSQKELKSTAGYTDFEYYIRPTFDFRQELLSQGNEVEVLEPASFRQEMKKMLEDMLHYYSESIV